MVIKSIGIDLSQTPQDLQNAVNDYIGRDEGCQVLEVRVRENRSHLDSNRYLRTYTVYLQCNNQLTIIDASIDASDTSIVDPGYEYYSRSKKDCRTVITVTRGY